MDKKAIEKELFIFFTSSSHMKHLNDMVTLLDAQIEKIEERYNECTSSLLIQTIKKQKDDKQLYKYQILEKIDRLKVLVNRVKFKLDALSIEYRKILELKYVNGYTQAQIAAELHISQSRISKITKVILAQIEAK